MMKPNSLDVKQLTLAFEQPEQNIIAVDDISFYLKPNETLALLGESGCGKSITSLSIMRLLPNNSAYGAHSQIHLQQQDILNISERDMRRLRGHRVAMIFQEPMTALNPVLTIGKQLSEAILQHQSLTRTALKKRILDLLQDVEIPEPEWRLNQYPHQLSGGQKQRIVIAMALAHHPDILIADEPTTALDVTIQAQILALLKKLQRQYGMSILLITHDLSVVKTVADRVCVMYAGQIVESAAVDAFFNQPLHPYVQKMLIAQPSMSKRHQQLQAIKGQVPALDAIPTGCRFHPRCPHVFAPCDHIIPELQRLPSGREVRCHLYPEHDKPPKLTFANNDHNTEVEATATIENAIILSVKNLSVHFKIKRGLWQYETLKAVDNLSFNVIRGQTLALVGESGCGKTTVARVLLRLQQATSGSVLYHDQDVLTLRGIALKQFHKNVQIIFQDPFSSLNPRLTIGEILIEGMQAQHMPKHKIQHRQCELLDQVNLPRASLKRYPHQFSGGQRQRICIARALATEPEILICDEPTSALDISVQAQILNVLKELQHNLGLSYVFITHNMAVVAYMADEVLVMKQGRSVEIGSCERVFNHPQQPYTKQLLEGILWD